LKKLIRKLIPVVLIVVAILPASSASANSPIKWDSIYFGHVKGFNVSTGSLPLNLYLREETPVYADIGDAEPIGALAPQIVKHIEIQEDYNQFGVKWYKIET
jgi:hypothetical protein